MQLRLLCVHILFPGAAAAPPKDAPKLGEQVQSSRSRPQDGASPQPLNRAAQQSMAFLTHSSTEDEFRVDYGGNKQPKTHLKSFLAGYDVSEALGKVMENEGLGHKFFWMLDHPDVCLRDVPSGSAPIMSKMAIEYKGPHAEELWREILQPKILQEILDGEVGSVAQLRFAPEYLYPAIIRAVEARNDNERFRNTIFNLVQSLSASKKAHLVQAIESVTFKNEILELVKDEAQRFWTFSQISDYCVVAGRSLDELGLTVDRLVQVSKASTDEQVFAVFSEILKIGKAEEFIRLLGKVLLKRSDPVRFFNEQPLEELTGLLLLINRSRMDQDLVDIVYSSLLHRSSGLNPGQRIWVAFASLSATIKPHSEGSVSEILFSHSNTWSVDYKAEILSQGRFYNVDQSGTILKSLDPSTMSADQIIPILGTMSKEQFAMLAASHTQASLLDELIKLGLAFPPNMRLWPKVYFNNTLRPLLLGRLLGANLDQMISILRIMIEQRCKDDIERTLDAMAPNSDTSFNQRIKLLAALEENVYHFAKKNNKGDFVSEFQKDERKALDKLKGSVSNEEGQWFQKLAEQYIDVLKMLEEQDYHYQEMTAIATAQLYGPFANRIRADLREALKMRNLVPLDVKLTLIHIREHDMWDRIAIKSTVDGGGWSGLSDSSGMAELYRSLVLSFRYEDGEQKLRCWKAIQEQWGKPSAAVLSQAMRAAWGNGHDFNQMSVDSLIEFIELGEDNPAADLTLKATEALERMEKGLLKLEFGKDSFVEMSRQMSVRHAVKLNLQKDPQNDSDQERPHVLGKEWEYKVRLWGQLCKQGILELSRHELPSLLRVAYSFGDPSLSSTLEDMKKKGDFWGSPDEIMRIYIKPLKDTRAG